MFTKIGRVISWITFAMGILVIAASFYIAPDIYAPDFNRASMAQATLWMKQGATLVCIGVALGVLCEISLKLDT